MRSVSCAEVRMADKEGPVDLVKGTLDCATHTSQNEIMDSTQNSEHVETTVNESYVVGPALQDSNANDTNQETDNPSAVDEKQSLEVGPDEKALNLTGSLDQTDTDGFSISGCSSMLSSQNTSNLSKGDAQKSGEQTLSVPLTGGAASHAGSDDPVVYRNYRIRKTQAILKSCIAQKIAFKDRYVELSRVFLNDPSQMPLDEIELLNMKCTQALNGEMSDLSDSSDTENVESLLPRKPKEKVSSHQSSSQDNPSYHHNWMAGPGNIHKGSDSQKQATYTTVPSQMSQQTGSLPGISQFYRNKPSSSVFGGSAFENQDYGPKFSQNSRVMSGVFGQNTHTSSILMPPTTTSTPIKPVSGIQGNTSGSSDVPLASRTDGQGNPQTSPYDPSKMTLAQSRALTEAKWKEIIHRKPLGQREFPLVYLQRREKPQHMTWERWFSFANEKYRASQEAELKQQEELRKRHESEENMAAALAMDFLGDSSVSFDSNRSEGNGISSSVTDTALKQHIKKENINGSTSSKKTSDAEPEMANKTLELSKDLQDIVLEIAELFLDPDVVFAMRKLKEVGKAMQNTPSAKSITNEITLVTTLEQRRQAELSQKNEHEKLLEKKDIKQEEEDEPKKTLQRPLFPSATRATSFEQFSNVMKAPKHKLGSPTKPGSMYSPKSAKKSNPTQKLKSLTETKMDIISEGFSVLKKKKSPKVSQAIWNEVSTMGRVILTPVDSSFYALMSNVFTHLEKLQENARGPQLKADLFDFIGENVKYSRDWAGGVLMKEGKEFWEYINACGKDATSTDPYQIVMLAQMLKRNISILYGNAEKWSTDPTMQDDIVLIYKGDGEFLPTDVDSSIDDDETRIWPESFVQLTKHKESLSDDTKSEQSTVSIDNSESGKTKKTRQAQAKKTEKKAEEVNYFKCSHCSYQTQDWSSFENHNKVLHRVRALFGCSVEKCYKFYISKNGLKGHCSRAHKDVLSCNMCDYIATSKNFLLDHKTSHDMKKFKCRYCSKGFGSNYDQGRHEAKCQLNPNRAITCKKCFEKGTPVDITGAEQGLVLHLQDQHSLKGDWLCVYCHRLYVKEKNFDLHVEKCKKSRGKAAPSSTEETETETEIDA